MLPLPTWICRLLWLVGVISLPQLLTAQEDLEMRGWDTIPAEELAASAPRIDPDAHCEFTYRKLKINDDGDQTSYSYHYRAKIFTEEGVARWDKVDLSYTTGFRVTGIRARVVFPDGSVTVLKSSDVFKRKMFEAESFKGYAKSFSFPGLKPGCIIEYEWKEIRAFWMPTITVPLREEWPTWLFDLTLRPYSRMSYSGISFYSNAAWVKKNGNLSIELKDQPAISEKPFLAARKDFEPWVFLEYASDYKSLEKEKYWGYRGGALLSINRGILKPKKKDVKALASRLFDDVPFSDDKLRAAYEYCVNEIVNIQEYTDKYTEEEIEDLKRNETPSDTIKHGYGTRFDINVLFASLASATGFEAQLTEVENHSEYTYRPDSCGGFNLSDWVVGIKYGVKWRYFDPGRSFLPFEVLDPENVEATTLQTDKEFYYVAKTPTVDDDFSKSVRIAKLNINEYGDAAGRVHLQYNGYAGIKRKRLYASMTEDEIKDFIEENDWRSRLPRASIEDLKIDNSASREDPLIVSYTVKVPGYADVIANRIVLRPSVFEAGKPPLFPDDERAEPIAFDFRTKVEDQIVFSVPDGFTLESQGALNIDQDNDFITRRSVVQFDDESGKLVYRQTYAQKLLVVRGARNYKILKACYDFISDVDSRSISLSKDEGELASAR